MAPSIHYRYDLFVSCAAADRSWVHGYFLPELGLSPDRIITKEQFTVGAPVISEFNRAISESRFTVLVLTPAYSADEWAMYSEEISSFVRVIERRDRLIPLQLRPTDLSLGVASLVSLDCTEPAQWEVEVGRLRQLLGRPEPPPEAIPCPYPGIESFTEKNAEFYIGREQTVRKVVDRLTRSFAVTVIGPSGSGKSSFLRAGLIPFLKHSVPSELVEWSVVDLRPGAQPMERLGTLLANYLPEPAENITEALRTERNSLAARLTQIASCRSGGRVILIVDQFEEIFRQCKDAKQQEFFFTRLRELFEARLDTVLLIMAVRSDFYGDCQNCPLWPHIQASLIDLLPLTPADLRRAVVEPAHKVGVFVEPALVERLMADAEAESGALPLLQETMASLWKNHLRRRLLALTDYETMGSDGRTGLQDALNARADATLSQLVGTRKRDMARRIFVRLVDFGQRLNTRREQSEDALRAAADPEQTFDEVLEFLIDQRLLTTDRDPKTGEGVVDLVHEALIDSWQQLGLWIESFHGMEEERRGLELSAAVWDAKRRDPSYLFAGRRLKEAQEWAQQWQSELGEREIAFLEQSLLRRRRQQRVLAASATAGGLAVVLILGLSIPRLLKAAQRASVRTHVGTELVHLAGGQAIVGSDDPDAEPSERLATVDLRPFAIEKYEVSVRQYKACVDSGPCEKPRIPDILEDASRFDYPIVHVSAKQARTYCVWLERRLPTSVEWERAARGYQGRLWPWGNDLKGCEEFVFGCGLVAVNAGDETATPPPERIYHLASNVSEWVVLVPNSCQGEACHAVWDGKTDQIAHRGGAWDIPLERITQVIRSSPDNFDESIGFRCVVEPSSAESTGK